MTDITEKYPVLDIANDGLLAEEIRHLEERLKEQTGEEVILIAYKNENPSD